MNSSVKGCHTNKHSKNTSARASVNTLQILCESRCAVCTQQRGWMSSLLLTQCSIAGETISPPSSIFMLCGGAKLWNSPVALFVDERRLVLCEFNLSWTPVLKCAQCWWLENKEYILVFAQEKSKIKSGVTESKTVFSSEEAPLWETLHLC